MRRGAGSAAFFRLPAVFGLPAVFAIACASSPEPPPKRADQPGPAPQADAGPGEFANRGPGVWLRVQPSDALVVIDGHEVGTAARLADDGGFLSLPAGLHQIVVRRDGFQTWRAEVTVREDTEPIDVELEALPTAPQ